MLNSAAIAKSARYKYWVFGALAIGTFASVVDHGSVMVALPSIAKDFQTDLPSAQWVVIGYALTISALLLPMGRLADIAGRKRIYVLGTLVLVVGSVVAGLAPNLGVLLVARFVQGIGAAMTQGTSMAIITSVFPAKERGRAIGLIMTTVGVGAVAGPAIGGLIVNALGWPAVFFMTIPLGLVGVAATLTVLKNWESEKAPAGSGFDWLGAVLSTGILVSLLLALTTAHKAGWTSAPILGVFIVSASLIGVFIWWELRARTPMLDLRFFKFRTFSFGICAAFFTFLGQSAVLFLMPFYIQNVLGYSPKVAGLVVVPGALAMAILGSVAGTLSDRFGFRWFTVGGLATSAAGLLLLTRITEDSSLWMVVPGLMLMSSGMGLFYSPNSSSVLSAVDRNNYGVVAGFLNLVRNSGNVVSLAIATTVVTTTMGSMGFEPSLEAVRGETVEGVRNAFTVGLRYTLFVLAGLVLTAMTISFFQGRPSRELEPIEGVAREQESAAPGD